MSMPATISTDVGTILCLVACATGGAFLRGIGRVYLLDLDAKSVRLVGDEQGQLREAPTIFHTVVFAGFRPTTCACRALANVMQGFDLDRSHALLSRVVHHLPGKLMVDIFHPSGLFTLAPFDGA